MQGLRQHVTWIVGAWLLCQASTVVLVPVSLCTGDSAGIAQQVVCTCSHDDGQECPMHHTKSKSTSSCSCRSTTDGRAATLVSLFGPAAVLIPRSSGVALTGTTELWANPDVILFDASFNPDPPPPRA